MRSSGSFDGATPSASRGGTALTGLPKVLVCGSREGFTYAEVYRGMVRYVPCGATVIHGAARGVDAMAGRAAADRDLRCIEFPADWQQHGKRAGILRNLQMLDEEPTRVLAFWDGQSRGTKHTIDEATRRGIEVKVIRPLEAAEATPAEGDLSPEAVETSSPDPSREGGAER